MTKTFCDKCQTEITTKGPLTGTIVVPGPSKKHWENVTYTVGVSVVQSREEDNRDFHFCHACLRGALKIEPTTL